MAPRSAEQFAAIRQSRRSSILGSALKLFARRGYNGTSVTAIAHGAGITKGQVYNYFRSKDDLLRDVLQEGYRRMEAIFEVAGRERQPAKELEVLLRACFSSVRKEQEFWSLYISLLARMESSPDYQSLPQRFYHTTLEHLVRILGRMGRSKPDYEARKLLAVLDGIGLHYVALFKGAFPMDVFEDELIREFCTTSEQRERVE